VRPRRRLWRRLLISHLAVIAIGSATLLVAVGLVGPAAFDAAMGHGTAGLEGMSAMMNDLVRSAYLDALRSALAIAIGASAVAALVVSIALATRVARPIARLARASSRIASSEPGMKTSRSSAFR